MASAWQEPQESGCFGTTPSIRDSWKGLNTLQAMENDSTRNSPTGNSGESGLPAMEFPSHWNFAEKLPFERKIHHIEESVPQHVGYGDLENTWMGMPDYPRCLPIAQAPANVFDNFIAPFFGSFTNVDRSLWPLAFRWRAVNDAMSDDRQQKELPRLVRIGIILYDGTEHYLLYAAPGFERDRQKNGNKNSAA
jgi:hypothetical protein